MSRVQLALNVDNLDDAVGFYTKLFGTEPVKRRSAYANFAISSPLLKLVLLENPGHGGTLNHLGIEADSSEEVETCEARLIGEGFLPDDEKGITCCYARQDKFWITGPDGEKWEHYIVLADSDTFGTSSSAADHQRDVCCDASGK